MIRRRVVGIMDGGTASEVALALKAGRPVVLPRAAEEAVEIAARLLAEGSGRG